MHEGSQWRSGWLLCLLLILSFAGKAALRLVVLHDPDYWESGYYPGSKVRHDCWRAGGVSPLMLHTVRGLTPPLAGAFLPCRGNIVCTSIWGIIISGRAMCTLRIPIPLEPASTRFDHRGIHS